MLPQVNDQVSNLATELCKMSFKLQAKTGELIVDCVGSNYDEHNGSEPR